MADGISPREAAQSYARLILGLNLGNSLGFGQTVTNGIPASSFVMALEKVFEVRKSKGDNLGLATGEDVTNALRDAGLTTEDAKRNPGAVMNAIRNAAITANKTKEKNTALATAEQDRKNLRLPPAQGTPTGEVMGPVKPAGLDDANAAEFVRKVANTLRAQAPSYKDKVDYEAWASQLISQGKVLANGSITGPILDGIDFSTIATSGAAGGGAGGGGFAPQQTTYSFANYPVAGRGNVLFKIASDGSNPVEVTGITLQNPLTDIAVEETTGDLLGYNPVTKQKELIKKGYSFPKSDPNIKIIFDKPTGKTISQNTVTGEKRELGTYDFPEISPQEAAAEAATIARLGPAASMRGQDISAYGTDRGQSINERLNQRTAGLNEFNTVKGILNSPSDYLARAFLSQGKASPGGNITQADLINSLRAEMGPFKQVSPALDLSQFNPETYKRMTDALAPTKTMDASGAANPLAGMSPAQLMAIQNQRIAAENARQAALDLLARNTNNSGVAYNASTPFVGSTYNASAIGGPTTTLANGQVIAGGWPSAAPAAPAASAVPAPMTGTVPAPAGSAPGAGAAPAAAGSANTYGGYGLGDSGAMPNFDAPAANTYGGYGLGDSGYAYGGATRDPRFIVGDRHDGRPTGTEEMIINPTRAPIQVVPNSRLAAYYGGTMPDRFADGTDSRLGMYPRYDEGTKYLGTADAPNKFNLLDFFMNPLIKADPTGSAGRDTALEIASDFTSPLSIALALLPGGLLVKGARGATLAAKGAQAAKAASTAKAAAGAAKAAENAFVSQMTGNTGKQAQRLLPEFSSFVRSAPDVVNAGGMTSREALLKNLSNFSKTPGFANRIPEILQQAQQSGGLINPQTRSQIQNLFRQNGQELTDDMWNALLRIREFSAPPRFRGNRFPLPDAVNDFGVGSGKAPGLGFPNQFSSPFRRGDIPMTSPRTINPNAGDIDAFIEELTRNNSGGVDIGRALGRSPNMNPNAGQYLDRSFGVTNPGYAEGTGSRLGEYPRYADGVLPVVQGAPAGSLAPITQDEIVNMARQYSPPVVNAVLGQGEAIPRQLPVQSASMRQTNNLTSEDMSALGTRLAAEGTSMTDYNALQQGLFGNKRTSRRGRLVI